jgi:hypothetical protein
MKKLEVNKFKESLEVRNEVIKMIREKFDLNFGYSFNDLYKVKGGIVRRLKGGIWRVDYGGMCREEYNNKFNEVKEFINNLDMEGFDIKLNKKVDYSWNDYFRFKGNGFEGSWEDYKNKKEFDEGTLILKIKWNV